MKIHVSNRQKDLRIKVATVRPVVKHVLEHENFTTDEVSINFVSKEEICRLHADFFNDPSPTDCISFPLDDPEEQSSGYHVLGEVFICPHTALEYDPASPYYEVTLYLVHGLLHLLGYDDIEAKKRKKMREAEKKHMDGVALKKLLLKAQ